MTHHTHTRSLLCATVALSLALLAGCSKEAEKKPGQALASVNGEEITVLQLNEEMMRANVQPQNQDAAKKTLLKALIDRQVILSQAEKESIDRDPKVVAAVERAKNMIIAQAYLQKHLGEVPKPSRDEVEAYYNANPQFFSARKQFNMDQLVIAGRDMNDEVKAAADTSRSLDELAAWLDEHKIRNTRGELVRTSSDLPPELGKRLTEIPKGQLFIVKELDRTLFLTLTDTKDAPLALDTAAPQIEQFLFNKKSREAAEAELARLRGTAKIEMLNGEPLPAAGPATPATNPATTATAAAPAATAVAAAPEAAAPASDVIQSGIADLK